MSIATVIKRIQKMQSMTQPDSPQVRQALTRIGMVLAAEMKMNAQRKNIVRNGGLINSIKYEVTQSGSEAFVSVGSFGIKYAAMNEFGGQMTRAQVRRMFVELKLEGKLNKSRVKGSGKGIVTVNADGTGYWQPRPFIRPAMKTHAQFIIDTIRQIGKP